jgi:HD-GYP domain-containing protein (c-di-GMP phosphodiesterase class II)
MGNIEDEDQRFTDENLKQDGLGPAMLRRTMAYCRSLARAVDSKGDYFPGHSDGVAYLVQLIGRELDIPRPMLMRLQIASLLHDTGKLRIPDSILLAPRKLTEDEFQVMKLHSVWSSEVAAAITGFDVDIAVWIRHHHESWNGKGYPDGVAGDDIPWQSRLMLVADAFHVMTAYRPYHSARSRTEAIAEMVMCAGVQFDPRFVDALMARPVVKRLDYGAFDAR